MTHATSLHWVILTRIPTGWRHLALRAWEHYHARPWQGHATLVMNTLRALRASGVRATLNPQRMPPTVSHVLIACGGASVLEWVQNRLAPQPHIWIGLAPTIADVGSSEMRAVEAIASPNTVPLAASGWHLERFRQEHPRLAKKACVWPCGVDTEKWTPPPGKARKGALIYMKRAPDGLGDAVGKAVENAGMQGDVVRYGAYTPASFLSALQHREVAIFLSDWESQGIALAEAWACDVPTLAWTPCNPDPWKVSAPWLTPQTGFPFHDTKDLAALLAARAWESCQARQWVLENMSLARSAQILKAIAGPPLPPSHRLPAQNPSDNKAPVHPISGKPL